MKALKSNTLPKRLLWLSCSSLHGQEQGTWVERWHHGALGSTHWTTKNGTRKDRLGDYADARELWQQASDFCVHGRRVVLFAYDLAYQLRISRALIYLPELGWSLDKIVLERTAAWALFRNGKRTLMCCDLKSWAPVDIGKLTADLEATGGHYPNAVAGVDYHADNCKRTCRIVRDAVLQIIEWLSAENLGPFRPTGSGQSYAAFRRRFMKQSPLVHDDRDLLHIERLGMWTGRCEAWQHGKLAASTYTEYDMQAAYCRIAAECEVPTVIKRTIEEPRTQTVERLMRSHAVLAECTIDTDVECIPASIASRTVWPVGTFNTVLWDPEIQLALQYANAITFKRIHVYDRAPILNEFARFVLDGMSEQTQVYGLIPQRVLKHWSRCLVGRLGLRFRAWQKFGTQDPPDLRLVTFLDVDEGTSTDMLIAGRDRLILAELSEATESLPQIPGWVMSECRRRLWKAMIGVGLQRVVYVDTDSIVVESPVRGDDHDYTVALPDDVWTIKGQYASMLIYGPRNLVCNSTRRVSGLPISARQIAPLEFSGQVMRSIKESMRAGELDCVANIPRNFVLDAPDLRRDHIANGRTKPYRLEQHGV